MSTNDVNMLMEAFRDLKEDVRNDLKDIKSDIKELRTDIEAVKRSKGPDWPDILKYLAKWFPVMFLAGTTLLATCQSTPEKAATAIQKATATASSTYVHLRAYDSLTGSYKDVQ